MTAPRAGGNAAIIASSASRAIPRASDSFATTGPWRTSGYMNGTPYSSYV